MSLPTPPATADPAIRVVLYMYRLPSISHEAFKSHYEKTHIPLIQSITKDDFPLIHKRRYVSESNVLFGTKTDFPYDALVEIEWQDQAHFDRFTAIVYGEEGKRLREEDEAKFIDMTRMVGIWQLDEKVSKRQ